MSVNEAVTGMTENDVKAIKAELKVVLGKAKLLAAAVAAKATGDEARDEAESMYDAIREMIGEL